MIDDRRCSGPQEDFVPPTRLEWIGPFAPCVLERSGEKPLTPFPTPPLGPRTDPEMRIVVPCCDVFALRSPTTPPLGSSQGAFRRRAKIWKSDIQLFQFASFLVEVVRCKRSPRGRIAERRPDAFVAEITRPPNVRPLASTRSE